MKEKNKTSGKYRKWILNTVFAVFVGLIAVYAVLGQILLPQQTVREEIEAGVLPVQWSRVLADGTRVPVELPGRVGAAAGETVVIEAQLPQELYDWNWISLDSLHQEIEIYIDGELREEFSTLDTMPFGKYSSSAYVFAEISREDAGKPIQVMWTTGSRFTGMLSKVYYGARIELWSQYFRMNVIQVGMALFLLLFSIIAIALGISMNRSFKKQFALEYLGWGILLMAVWMLCESRLRQLFFDNISAVSDVAFLATGLIPYPFAEYFDRIQKGRYRRYYQAVKVACLIVFFICVILHVGHVADFSDSMVLMHLMIFAMLFTAGITMILDILHKRLRDYLLVFIGYIGLLAATVYEIIGIYRAENHSRVLVVASFFLFVMAVLKMGQDIVELEREKQEALATNQTKNNFLANMSHEIRTPINSIIGMNQLILRESTEPHVLEYAGNVENASKLLVTLVNDILDFSKMESGKLEIVEKSYQLASLLNDEVHLLEKRAEKKNLQVMVSIDESLPSTLVGDDMRIRQVITNLVTNAVKYTKEGSISFTAYGEWRDYENFVLKVAVQDTGVGIRREDQERLFQRFVRFDIQKNSTVEGSGLGLAITKRLVDLMRGEIRVESEYGKGSTFFLSLPQEVVSRGPVGNLERAYQNEVFSRRKYHEAFHAPGAKVLAVDDNTMNLAVVKGLLKRTEIMLDTATSGMECLQMTRKKKYHLIFMDHMMPEMDGIQTFHELRGEKDNPNSDTKVIALTANAIAGSREEYLREGFVDYISKPIDAAELEIVLMSYLPEELVITEEKERERLAAMKEAAEKSGEASLADAKSGQEESGGRSVSAAESGGQGRDSSGSEKQAESAQGSGEPSVNAADGGLGEEQPDNESHMLHAQAESGQAMPDQGGNPNAYIDRAVGITHCMDMEDMYIEILQDYCTEGNSYQEKLAACLAKEDWKNFAVYVHAVKSSSKTIGAEIFGEEARVLEMAAKEQDIALIRGNWEQFCVDFEAVIAAAEKLRAELAG